VNIETLQLFVRKSTTLIVICVMAFSLKLFIEFLFPARPLMVWAGVGLFLVKCAHAILDNLEKGDAKVR
jgi:hypothetical protein